MSDRYQEFSRDDLLDMIKSLRINYEGEQTHTAYLRERLRDVSRALGNTSCNADYADLAPAVAELRAELERHRDALARLAALLPDLGGVK